MTQIVLKVPINQPTWFMMDIDEQIVPVICGNYSHYCNSLTESFFAVLTGFKVW